MVDIISESKQELSFEKIVRCLRNYGMPIVILVIIISIAFSIWFSRSADISANIGDTMYEAVIMDVDQEKRINLLKEVIQYNSGYKYIAQLKLADILSKKEDSIADAIAVYEDLQKNEKAEDYIRDMATQRLMILNNHEIANGIYYFSDSLIKATLLVQQGKDEEALSILHALQENFETPDPVKELASEIKASLNGSTKPN